MAATPIVRVSSLSMTYDSHLSVATLNYGGCSVDLNGCYSYEFYAGGISIDCCKRDGSFRTAIYGSEGFTEKNFTKSASCQGEIKPSHFNNDKYYSPFFRGLFFITLKYKVLANSAWEYYTFDQIATPGVMEISEAIPDFLPTPPTARITSQNASGASVSISLSGEKLNAYEDKVTEYWIEAFTSSSENGSYTDSGIGWSLGTSKTITVNPSEYFQGKYVKFQPWIKTIEFPQWTKATTFTETVKTNSPPNAPSLVLPPSDAGHYNTSKAWIRLKAGSDADGTAQKYTITCNGQTSASLPHQGMADFVITGQNYSATTSDGVNSSTTLSGSISVLALPWSGRLAAGEAVLASHLTTLRTAVNNLRKYYGLSQIAFTDPTITAGKTQVKAAHVVELQQALTAILNVNTTVSKPTWESVAPNGRIKASHFNQLREIIEKL